MVELACSHSSGRPAGGSWTDSRPLQQRVALGLFIVGIKLAGSNVTFSMGGSNATNCAALRRTCYGMALVLLHR